MGVFIEQRTMMEKFSILLLFSSLNAYMPESNVSVRLTMALNKKPTLKNEKCPYMCVVALHKQQAKNGKNNGYC